MPEPESPIAGLIEALRAFRGRRAMYIAPVDVASVLNFLHGFRTACHGWGVPIDPEQRWRVEASRGWQVDACGPVPSMEAKGLTPEQIMDELVEIEIATLEAMAGSRG